MKKSKDQIIFDTVNITLLCIFGLLFVLPFLLVVSSSFTDEMYLNTHGAVLFPVKFSLEGYKWLFEMSDTFVHSILVTIWYAIMSVGLSIIINTLFAFPMTKANLAGRKFIATYILIPMLFSGGLIPTYLIIEKFGLLNTLWSAIIPGAFNTMTIFLLRNYFMAIPPSLTESATLDGAKNIDVLLKIYLPMSKPVYATLLLQGFVGAWNMWMPCLLYIDSEHANLYTMQYVIRNILADANDLAGQLGLGVSTGIPTQSLKNATMVISILPILAIYPFLHKYLINGTIVGAVKG